MTRMPTKKSLNDITVEEAHGGSGRRQVIFSASEPFVSSQFEAMTKGFLPSGAAYDWHMHDNIDEFFIVTSGTGIIHYENGTSFEYKANDVIYNPAGLSHKIDNTGSEESEFFFVRIKA